MEVTKNPFYLHRLSAFFIHFQRFARVEIGQGSLTSPVPVMKQLTNNLLFFVKRSKPCSNGEVPIFARLSFNSERIEFSLNLSVPPNCWDAARNRVGGNSEKSKQINGRLSALAVHHLRLTNDLLDSGEPLRIRELRDKLLGIKAQSSTIVSLFEQHNREMRQRIGLDYAPLTIQRYNAALMRLRSYMSYRYRVKDVPVETIDHEFIAGFEHFLKAHCRCQHNTAMKHMKSLKKIIKRALAEEMITKCPFRSYVISIKHIEKAYLTDPELVHMAGKVFDVDRIAQVRDVFLFQCYTGLAYGDLLKLKIEHVRTHEGGKLWIMTDRKKTGIKCNIPLLPPAKRILERYADHPCRVLEGRLLPVLSNQKMNGYLKEVGDICGFNKRLTTHMARHTFATTVTLSKGVSIESVSKMLGHRRIQTTQVYAKVVDTRVAKEMDTIANEIYQ